MITPNPTALAPRIALLGCGTVGREVAARLLASDRPTGSPQLAKVLVRDPARPRDLPTHTRGLLTASFDDVLAAEPDIVIELLGGLDPATDLIARSLSAGIHVATANKTVIAHHGQTLSDLARSRGAGLAFEGSVCAGLPVLAALDRLRGDRILAIRGIISGSCNFILGRLAAGVAFDRAVAEAQRRGLVEPDPSADLSGRDCAEKACILAAAAGFPEVSPKDVELEGIERLTAADLAAARRTGHTIKLVAELDLAYARPRVRVGPTLVPLTHPLAAVHGEENAVLITAELAGDLLLRGRGAGPAPTASAVLGDVARLLGHRLTGPVSAMPTPSVTRPERAKRGYFLCAAPGAGVGPSPGDVLAALERHNIFARDVAVGRGGAHVLTAAADAGQAWACGEAISRGGCSSLAIPVLGKGG